MIVGLGGMTGSVARRRRLRLRGGRSDLQRHDPDSADRGPSQARRLPTRDSLPSLRARERRATAFFSAASSRSRSSARSLRRMRSPLRSGRAGEEGPRPVRAPGVSRGGGRYSCSPAGQPGSADELPEIRRGADRSLLRIRETGARPVPVISPREEIVSRPRPPSSAHHPRSRGSRAPAARRGWPRARPRPPYW